MKLDTPVLIAALQSQQPIDPVAFAAEWSDAAIRKDPRLEDALWVAVGGLLAKPIAHAKHAYLRETIFCLPIWDDEALFLRLKREAEDVHDAIVKEMQEIRDGQLDRDHPIRSLQNIDGNVEQLSQLPIELAEQFLDAELREAAHVYVLAPLLQLRARDAIEVFRQTLLSTTGLTAEHIVPWSPEEACDDPAARLPGVSDISRLLYIAPVKCIERLQAKVQDYFRDDDWKGGVMQLGDCLRCTVECDSYDLVWETWEQLREGFGLRDGNCRLKNNMTATLLSKPPDLLINGAFEYRTGQKIVIEVQVGA